VGKDEDIPSVDCAGTGDHAVARDLALAHAKGLGPVHGKRVKLGERSRVAEELDPLPRGQLALRVLL